MEDLIVWRRKVIGETIMKYGWWSREPSRGRGLNPFRSAGCGIDRRVTHPPLTDQSGRRKTGLQQRTQDIDLVL